MTPAVFLHADRRDVQVSTEPAMTNPSRPKEDGTSPWNAQPDPYRSFGLGPDHFALLGIEPSPPFDGGVLLLRRVATARGYAVVEAEGRTWLEARPTDVGDGRGSFVPGLADPEVDALVRECVQAGAEGVTALAVRTLANRRITTEDEARRAIREVHGRLDDRAVVLSRIGGVLRAWANEVTHQNWQPPTDPGPLADEAYALAVRAAPVQSVIAALPYGPDGDALSVTTRWGLRHWMMELAEITDDVIDLVSALAAPAALSLRFDVSQADVERPSADRVDLVMRVARPLMDVGRAESERRRAEREAIRKAKAEIDELTPVDRAAITPMFVWSAAESKDGKKANPWIGEFAHRIRTEMKCRNDVGKERPPPWDIVLDVVETTAELLGQPWLADERFLKRQAKQFGPC